MSQNQDPTAIQSVGKSGDNHAAEHNDMGADLISCWSGSARPSWAVKGTRWLKTSVSPHEYYMYDGTSDVLLGYVNTTTHVLYQNPLYLNSGVKVQAGSGSPEGVVTAPIGSLYCRTDGSTGTTLYVKESGTGNTGWVAK